jgi:hypothetical protein
MEQKYAPPDDPVFDLVPHAFAVHANAVWADMGSPEPQFSNAWDIYLHLRDALRSMAWDGAFRQCLSAASQPEHFLEELPPDLRQDEDEDEPLVVDISDHEGDTLTVDLTDTEEEGNTSIGLEF